MVKEVKIPLTKKEYITLKSISALKGRSMREFCRRAILKEIKKR